jgi:uncharacterized membrane protein
MDPREFQKQLDDQKIVDAIVDAEKSTSGEIRVFVRRGACANPLAAAHAELDRQGMKKTPLRNAVLIYLVPSARQFAVAADEGIHLRCGEAFWKSVAEEMSALMREGRFTEAVLAGIRRAGQELTRHFPKFDGDRDDLPNTVIRE